MEPWEYLVETIKNAEVGALGSKLNAWGSQGWELVSLTSTIKVVAAAGNDLVLVLKRRGLGEMREEDKPGYIAY